MYLLKRQITAFIYFLLISTTQAWAQPGTILFSDDFESGFAQWAAAGTGDASIGTETANSGTSSMRLRWNTITSTSIAINAAVPAATLDVWVRRGDDSFSEDPDIGGSEDLTLQYLDNTATWVTIETFLAGAPTGQIFTRTYTLPANALHAALQVRFMMPGGSGGPPANAGIGWDYWHVDDVIVTEIAVPPPLGVGSCDDFESGFTNWTAAGAGDAGVSGFTANSGTASMHTRWDIVSATSNVIDTSTTNSPLVTVWIRRGGDTFSENPEAGEDLIVEYLNNVGVWNILETLPGNGTQGETFTPTYLLPADAIHAGFRLRFRQTGGSGGPPANNGLGWDYWHIDDVCFVDNVSTYYEMDDIAWVGPGDVFDESANAIHGNPVGGVSTATATPAIVGNPGTCGYGVIPFNANRGTIDAVDSTITPTSFGAMTFWYRSTTLWNGGSNRMLLDASNELGNPSADKHFFLVLRNDGRLRFRLEDTADLAMTANTGVFNFPANTWVHIGITWDLPNDRTEIYVNSVLSGTSTTNVNGTLGNVSTLYIGDNRMNGAGGGGSTGRSANGLIDEVRFYSLPIPQATVAADMAATHPCTLTDHYDINHDGAAVTCQAETITIEAHMADHTVDTAYTGTMNLNTSTSNGDWTLITGGGPLNNGAADDGAADYTFVGGDNGVVVLGLKNTHTETININASDGTITETTGSALASEDQNLDFAESGFQFLADSVANTIGLQIGGKPSNIAPGAQTLELQAIRTSDSTGACEAALTGVNVIQMAFECENPTVCTANQVLINGVTNIPGNNLGPVGSYAGVSLDFGNNADTTATFTLNYADVGQIQLHALYDIPLSGGGPSGNSMSGASNSFVVRPFAFDVTVTGNPAATSSAGASFRRAGTNFQVNSRAVLWSAADDADNDGIADNHDDTDPSNNANLSDNTAALNYGQEIATENVGLSGLLDQPSGGNDPNISGTTTITSFVAGSGNTSNSTQYGEVGIIEITSSINDNNYLGIGAGPTANIIGKSGYVGRFYPNHFALTPGGTINNRVAMACAPASNFTYLGENLRLEFTLTAQNTSNATTQNYISGFAKLVPTAIASFNIGAIDNAAPTPLTSRITTVSSSGNWAAGVANLFATISFDRAATPDGPYQNVDIGIDPSDSDSVQLNTYNIDVDDDSSNDHGLVSNTDLLFGRLRLENVSGSELLVQTVPLHAEYYNGTQFIRNTNDSCSTYDVVDLSFSNRQDMAADPTALGSGTLITGTFDPGNPITLNANGDDGNIDATLNVPTWLEFDWDNDGNHDNDPTSHVTFGVFNSSDRQIYIREVY